MSCTDLRLISIKLFIDANIELHYLSTLHYITLKMFLQVTPATTEVEVSGGPVVKEKLLNITEEKASLIYSAQKL